MNGCYHWQLSNRNIVSILSPVRNILSLALQVSSLHIIGSLNSAMLEYLNTICACKIARLAMNYAKLGWNQVHALGYTYLNKKGCESTSSHSFCSFEGSCWHLGILAWRACALAGTGSDSTPEYSSDSANWVHI